MKITNVFSHLIAAGLALTLSASMIDDASAAGKSKKPRQVDWSFSGPFGHWDLGQLQRGLMIYKDKCSACHALSLVAFRNLKDLGYDEEQIKAFAAEYEITDGPNAEGDMFERPGKPADRFPPIFANDEAAASVNNGAVPPDFSLLAKARAPERGFPTFVFDVFTMYAENGPDYIYSLMTGYQDAPDGVEVAEGTHYNPYFIGGETLAMAPQLEDDEFEYNDGSPQTVDQYAKDIAAFMMWAAEPKLVERKALGFKVMLFLVLFSILLYFTKKSIFARLKN